MAMTACFAGPFFNILMGLGLGFGRLAAQTGQSEFQVSLSPSVVTGFLFIVLNSVTIIATGLFFGEIGTIPKNYGYIALTLYTVYLVTSISLQYSKYGQEKEV
jgi:sodium/potassium/calcium exchanger 6